MSVNVSPVNSFILDVLINDSPFNGTYMASNDVVKYLKSGNVVFVVTYPKLVTIKNTEELLNNVKLLFEQNQNQDPDQKEEKRERIGSKIDSILTAFDSQRPIEVESQVEEEEKGKEKEKKVGKQIKGGKKSRKWGEDGLFYDDNNDSNEQELDFSNSKGQDVNESSSANLNQLVGDTKDYGTKKGDKFLINDLSELQAKQKQKEDTTEQTGVVSGLKKIWGQYIGGAPITDQDLKKVKIKVIEQLVKKNMSNSVCESLMNEVENSILSQHQRKDSFTSLETIIKNEMSIKLRKLLTPTTSINLLSEIDLKNEPYVISVVGVNGVGKSTNLSKLAYWLLQNNYKVLIAACDTFRSGAVEQLRVHVNNLSKLSTQKIELFELGYGGKDLVSKIARGAIQYAKDNQFDVILMDTAGRRHNDTQLMAPLASFAKVANPDKIIMVGEALVGSDSVMQAQNFNNAFGKGRGLDAFIVSKCDTVGGQLGSIVDLVYATKVPVLFVGVGQTYTDLRVLSVEWVISQLLT